MQNESNIFDWIPVGPGNPLPDYDEYVLWRNVSGNFCVYCIFKDDESMWWTGKFQMRESMRVTHWCRIIPPVNF